MTACVTPKLSCCDSRLVSKIGSDKGGDQDLIIFEASAQTQPLLNLNKFKTRLDGSASMGQRKERNSTRNPQDSLSAQALCLKEIKV